MKAYFALKMIGDSVDAPHMARAREAIRSRGGAARANIFTRIMLALFGFIPWRAVPEMPIEIMLFPKWFPFHLDKISYWSRTVIVPLLVLIALKPRARNPKNIRIDELFLDPPATLGPSPKAPQQNAALFWFFRFADNLLRWGGPMFPKKKHRLAIETAVAWVGERLNGEDGLGAIFPAMANSVMMYDALGYPPDHPQRAIARLSVEKLLVVHADEAYCQPCVSPIWDTGLASHALLETGDDEALRRVTKGLQWLESKQILDVRGDWIARRPHVRPGGWAFQYANPHYPDVDDTAVVALAMDRAQEPRSEDRSPTRRSRGRRNGSSDCRAGTAAGARSTPTTNTILSITFRSPTTAPCSIRRPRTSPRVVCRCWRSLAKCRRTRPRFRPRWITSSARSLPMGAGTDAGA